MAIKERKQITGTEAQIKGYAGHNGVLAYATDTKHLHVLSGTAGTTTKLANMSAVDAVQAQVNDVQAQVNDVQAQVSAIPKPKAYITETWHSGTSWYRKWSDGFIEQGGVTHVGGINVAPLTFPHPFSNTYYSISGYPEENIYSYTAIGVQVSVRTNTSCGLIATGVAGIDDAEPIDYEIYWAAVGY